MTEQDEESKRELFRNLTGPNSKIDLAHGRILDHKLKGVDTREETRNNKLVSVLMRTFIIGFPSSSGGISFGSAFALDYQGRQYLITASHVIKFPGGTGKKGTIHIFRNNEWNPIEVTVVGRGDANNPEDDIAVLAADTHLPIPLTLSGESFKPSVVNMFWGQRVYFCGFPYGQYIKKDVIEGHPLAMTKGATLSGIHTKSGTRTEREKGLFILDGHNNEGFSGGPAVFQLEEDRNADFQVFGVVSGYRTNKVNIKHQKGEPTEFIGIGNTGLMFCPSIMRAVKMIETTPIGFEIF